MDYFRENSSPLAAVLDIAHRRDSLRRARRVGHRSFGDLIDGQANHSENPARKQCGNRLLLRHKEELADNDRQDGGSQIRPRGQKARRVQRSQNQVKASPARALWQLPISPAELLMLVPTTPGLRAYS